MTVEEIQNILSSGQFLNAELIQDNKVHFHHNDNVYRVRMPSQKELSEVNRYKYGYQVELMKTPNMLTEENLKKLLKESQNIDVDKIEQELKNEEEKLYDTWLKMSPLRDEQTEEINKYKKEIDIINNKRAELIEKIGKYLLPSIEKQLENYYMSYLTALCTEKLIQREDKNDKWLKAWDNFDGYMNDESTLRIYAMNVLTKLMMNIDIK